MAVRKPSEGPKIDAKRKLARDKARIKRATDAEFRRRENDKARRRAQLTRLAQYGLTEEDAARIVEKQNGGCAICGTPFVDYEGRKRAGKPQIDHNHKTKQFRGFLCQGCNGLLGQARESPKILQAAISYLRLTAPQEKVWGRTECLISTPAFELHRLTIEPMARCSLHFHTTKLNGFYVVEGVLHIDSVAGDFQHPTTETLVAEEYAIVRPGVHHQFRTGEAPAVVLEMYFTEPLSEDIVRRNIGERLKHD